MAAILYTGRLTNEGSCDAKNDAGGAGFAVTESKELAGRSQGCAVWLSPEARRDGVIEWDS